MFDHQKEITQDTTAQVGRAYQGTGWVRPGEVATCLLERKTAAQIEQEIEFARQNGISATPTVFVNGMKNQISAPEQVQTIIRQLSDQKAGGAGQSSGRQ